MKKVRERRSHAFPFHYTTHLMSNVAKSLACSFSFGLHLSLAMFARRRAALRWNWTFKKLFVRVLSLVSNLNNRKTMCPQRNAMSDK